jgi:hypothetical protein
MIATKTPRKRKRKMETSIAPLTLIDKCPRSPLSEGRSYGIAFAFAKREGDTLSLVGPLSPCKDYLNDQLYSEQSGKPYGAWGYKSVKTGCFEGGFAYLIFAILPQKGSSSLTSYSNQQKETKYLAESFHLVEKFIGLLTNCFHQSAAGVSVVKLEDNRYVAILPLFWVQYTYLISFLTLCMRIAVETYYGGQDDVIAYIRECDTGDSSYITSAKHKIDAMLKGVFPVQTFEATSGWHDMGIHYFKGFKNES